MNAVHAHRVFFLAIVLTLASLVAGGCAQNPATGRMQLMLISDAEANQLGNEAKPELINEYGGEVEIAELREYVSEVGFRVADEVEPEFADIEWSFVVLDSDVINAFAMPGGNVFISRGLLAQFDNEAQLAGVLGHEIGHLTGRHVNERISRAVGFQIGVQTIGAMSESQVAVLVADLVSGGYQLKFSRDQETEADELGIRYMVAAGYDPRGMLQVLEVLEQASRGAMPPEILSTHPHPETRIAKAERLIGDRFAFTRDNPDFELRREAFQQQAVPHLSVPENDMAGVSLGGWCGCCGATQRTILAIIED